MGNPSKEPKMEIGRSIYAPKPAPTKGRPIIPIEDD